MKRVRLRDCIHHVYPAGWIPIAEHPVLVPGQDRKRGWTGYVVAFIGPDIVRVRIPRFRNSLKDFLVSEVRPHPWL